MSQHPTTKDALAWMDETGHGVADAIRHFAPGASAALEKQLGNRWRQALFRRQAGAGKRVAKAAKNKKRTSRTARRRNSLKQRDRTIGAERLRSEIDALLVDLQESRDDESWHQLAGLYTAVIDAGDRLHGSEVTEDYEIDVRHPGEVAERLLSAVLWLEEQGYVPVERIRQDEDEDEDAGPGDWSALRLWRTLTEDCTGDLASVRDARLYTRVGPLSARHNKLSRRWEDCQRSADILDSRKVDPEPGDILRAVQSYRDTLERITHYVEPMEPVDLDEVAELAEWFGAVSRQMPIALWRAWRSDNGQPSQRDAVLDLLDPAVVVGVLLGGNRSGKTALNKALSVLHAIGRDHPATQMWCLLNDVPAHLFPAGPGRVWLVALSSGDSVRYHRPDIDALIPRDQGVEWYNRNGNGESRVFIRVPGHDRKAEIWFKSCDQGREKLQGDRVRYIGFDEEPPSKGLMQEAKMRIGDESGRILLSMTPLNGLTWVYDDYIDKPEPGSRALTINSENNPHIPREYFRKLYLGMSEAEIQARRDGKFVTMRGKVYHTYDVNTHVIDAFTPPAHWLRFRAMDFGQANPTAVLWAVADPDTRSIYVYREHYKAGKDTAYHARMILDLEGSDTERPEVIEMGWGDPAAAPDIEYMAAEHDVYMGLADNRWDYGRNTVSRYLAEDPDIERPRLFFMRGAAPNTEREIVNYAYKPEFHGIQQERPPKKNDHAMDALRYLVVGIDSYMGWSFAF